MRSHIRPKPALKGGRSRYGRGLGLVTMLSAVAGCGPTSESGEWLTEPIGGAEEPIVNGQLDSGDPAVVALTTDSSFFCSGTLIAPRVVLTAAHCLPPNISDYANSYTQLYVYFGNNVFAAGGQYIGVVDGWTHPDWWADAINDDIGLLRLAENGPTTPIPPNTTSLTYSNDHGEAVRIVGFGQTAETSYDSAGVKREGNTAVDEVDTFVFTMGMDPSGICSGDSGGAALMVKGGQEVVAGINSRADCLTISIDTRVDRYASDIENFIGATPDPSCDGDGLCATGCAAPDPDCPCAGDGFCGAACPDVTQDPDCNADCAANGVCVSSGCPAPDPDCPNCAADGACDDRCEPGADPDCVVSCPSDGVCDRACTPDPDCWLAGAAGNRSYDGDLQSGCAITAPASGHGPGWLGALVATWLATVTRRRTRSTNR